MELISKLQRIAELRKYLEDDDQIIKQETVKLTTQKALYASKLNDIQAIGNNLEW